VATSISTAPLDVEFKDDLVGYRSGHGAQSHRACFATRSRACQQNQPERKNWKKISKLQPTTCSNYLTVSGR
jgi:hypothetical protein